MYSSLTSRVRASERECVMNLLEMKLSKTFVAFVVQDKNTKEQFHLEDCVCMFRKKASALAHLKDEDVVFLNEEDRKRPTEVVRVEVRPHDNDKYTKCYYAALNEKNEVLEDEDSFLYVYESKEDLEDYDREKFAPVMLVQKPAYQ